MEVTIGGESPFLLRFPVFVVLDKRDDGVLILPYKAYTDFGVTVALYTKREYANVMSETKPGLISRGFSREEILILLCRERDVIHVTIDYLDGIAEEPRFVPFGEFIECLK